MTSISCAPPVEVIDGLLSRDGWAHASSVPVEDGDPGRFHALFGRDSLIFAFQLLPHRPEIAVATLRTLASLQGTTQDPEIDEEPGKIIHEYHEVAPDRLIHAGWVVRDGGIRYYGSSDATSWFLVVLEATGNAELQTELSAYWRAAASWLEHALDAGGGFVRFGPRKHGGGLTQQGWRDFGQSRSGRLGQWDCHRGDQSAATAGGRCGFPSRRCCGFACPDEARPGSGTALATTAD